MHFYYDFRIILVLVIVILSLDSSLCYNRNSLIRFILRSASVTRNKSFSTYFFAQKLFVFQAQFGNEPFLDELKRVGEKKLLQEVCQFLFNGENPAYVWDEKNTTLTIRIPNNFEYSAVLYNSTESLNSTVRTIATKKAFEIRTAANFLQDLISTRAYSQIVLSWLTRRMSRNNIPTKITRPELFSRARSVSTIVMIDIENVADFRQNFHVNKEGRILCSAPCLPKLLSAPNLDSSVTSNSVSTASKQLLSENPQIINNELEINYQNDDEDSMLILTYAHARSPQTVMANRLTLDNRKDAADGYCFPLITDFNNNMPLRMPFNSPDSLRFGRVADYWEYPSSAARYER